MTTTGASQWRRDIFDQMMARIHSMEQDNFDDIRYAGVAPNVFFAQHHAIYLDYFCDHWAAFFSTREKLEDESSRRLLDELVLYRLLGHLHVRLPMNTQAGTVRRHIPEEWRVSESEDGGQFGKLSVFQVPVGNTDVWVKCWAGNVAAYLSRQYYFARGGVDIAPQPGDHVIDGGGCFGDTSLFFANDVGPNGRIYTFDPLKKHCAIMREAMLLNDGLQSRITLFEAGLADVDEAGDVSTGDDINPGARVGIGSGLNLRAIDSVVADGDIARVDFIKLDIEGSELAALRGGEQSLRRWKPKLAISLYHRLEDFHAIPAWLDGLGLGYKFYLDHYTIHAEETVLYAVA